MTAWAVCWIDVTIASVQQSEVVDENKVARPRIQAMLVLGRQDRKNFEGLELCWAQSRNGRFSAGRSSCRVKAQTARIDAYEDLAVGNLQERRKDVTHWITGSVGMKAEELVMHPAERIRDVTEAKVHPNGKVRQV